MRVPHLAVSLALALAACGGSGRSAASGTTTSSTIATTTTERQATVPATPPPTAVEPTTKTTEWTGLPSQFPIAQDDALILTDDSTRSQSLSIARVDLVSAHDWFAAGVVNIGFEVTFDDGYNRIEFHGRGSDGIVLLTDRGDGVHIDVQIEQFRPFK